MGTDHSDGLAVFDLLVPKTDLSGGMFPGLKPVQYTALREPQKCNWVNRHLRGGHFEHGFRFEGVSETI